MPGQPDFKNPPRLVTSDWSPLREAKMGPCRSCGANTHVQLHHTVPRSLGGHDTADGVVPLCMSCHMEYEDRGPRWPVIAAAIRDSLSPEESQYIIDQKGEDFLDRYLPTGGQACPTCGRKKRSAKRSIPQTAESPKQRKRWVISLPADEPGAAEALDELVTQAKEKLVSADAVASDVGPFVVLCAVLYEFNTA